MTILVFLCIGLSVLALGGGAFVLARGDRAFDARLTALGGRRDAPRVGAGFAEMGPALLRTLVRWGQTAGRGSLDSDKRAHLRLRLVQAGFYSDRSAEAFFGIRAAAALAMGAVALLLCLALGLGVLWCVLATMLGANIGLFVPNFVLASRISERSAAMYRGLPDAVDLMIVCLEAGGTLGAAVQRVGQEFGEMHPMVAEQFGIVMDEMQAGASRSDALLRLSRRVPGDEMRTFTTMIVQSDVVGASLGDTLRVFADSLRKTRFLDAERKAAELPVKLAFPLVLFIFPCLATVIFIPVVIRAIRALAG